MSFLPAVRPISAGRAEIFISQNLPSDPSGSMATTGRLLSGNNAHVRPFGEVFRGSLCRRRNAKLTTMAIDAMLEKKIAKMGDEAVQGWGIIERAKTTQTSLLAPLVSSVTA